MLYKKYFSSNFVNQEIFNKKVNWFFDIKSILYQKRNNYKQETIKYSKIIVNNFLKTKLYKKNKIKIQKIIVKHINKSAFLKRDKVYKMKILKCFNYLKKNKIDDYIKIFCVHGSIASDDYIKNWSDLDTFVVIKNETLKNEIKLRKLRNILRNFFIKLTKVSPYQHHGLIMYTENDLNHYLKGYLPMQALEKSFSVFGKVIFEIKEKKNKSNLSLKSLEERKKYLKESILKGKYNHHAFKGRKLNVPLKENSNQMYQLFCHIGYILNIPILYLDATNRSIHKKKSFNKFYKEIKDNNIKKFIKKTEAVRTNWNEHKFQGNKIPLWIIKILGNDYMEESYKIISKIIKIIRSH
jgi:predicted nucleotidyltransferase